MREIKFRAWDKVHKAMFQALTSINLDGDVHSCTFLSGAGDEWTVPVKDLELMQYTGFRDANGKEIYEGDILSPVFMTCDPNDRRYENCKVFFDDGCFSVYCSEDYQPCLWEIDDTVTEVIGNTTENPELAGGE